MAVALDNKKHDVQLNDVPYRIRGYQRSELSTFIPRLGAGESSESQFDLLRSASIKRFAGGELQRYWNDESSAFGIEGLENKYDDGVLYPTDVLETVDGDIYPTTGSKPKVTAWVRSDDYLFVAYRTYSGTCGIYRKDKSGTVVALTVPSSISSGLPISDMVIYNEQLWICNGGTNPSLHWVALSSTSVAAISAGTTTASKMTVFNGELYLIGGNVTSQLYRYTGNTTTKSSESVGDTNKGNTNDNNNLFVYNNRIILTRHDGMWGYDGVVLRSIEDMVGVENTNNYRVPAVLRGYLYYFMPDGFYRYNGSLIEKLYDISESGIPESVAYGDNKLYYVYRNSAYSGSTRYDKSMGYDFEAGDEVQGRLVYFDGQGMFTHSRLATFDKGTITEDFAGQGEPDHVLFFNGDLYVSTWHSKFTTNLHRIKAAQPSTRSIQIVTSIYDGGFPQIFKQLEETEMALDGNTGFAHAITIEARTETTVGGFEGDGGWIQVGTGQVSNNLIMPVYDQSVLKMRFKKIQFRITASLSPETGIEKFIIRFTLQPDYKYQWTFTALCYGDLNLSPLQLQDITDGTEDVAKLRGNIYQSRESDYPVAFVDLDYLTLNEDINASVNSAAIVSGCADILKANEGFLQCGTEIMKYEKDTDDNILLTRGVLGSTATSHTSGDLMYPYYRVIVRQIQNERIELSDENLDTLPRTRDSEITLVLQEV